MSNPIKYSTGSESQALKKGSMFFGSGDVGKGPTSSTGYYNGYSPPSGGYMIYLYKSGAPGDLSYFSAANDTQLISFTNNLASTSFTSATQCLNYFNTQTDKMVFNIDYPPIVTSGLVLNYDVGFVSSYSTSGTTIYDLSPTQKNGILTNGPTYSNGYLLYDGTDDYINITYNSTFNLIESHTLETWFYPLSGGSSESVLMRTGQGSDIIYSQFFGKSSLSVSYQYYNNGFITVSAPNNVVTLNNWFLFTAVKDSTSLKLYINGVLVKDTTISNSTANWLGTINIGNCSGNGFQIYNGRISQSRIYNRGLTADEVLQNYAAMGSRYLPLQVQYLVVAGGGGGGSSRSGGGGAGGLLSGVTTSLSLNTNYTVTVGAGGSYNTNGSNSVFDTSTSIGGGRSGDLHGNGFSGGSGGGSGAQWYDDTPRIGGSAISGQGFSGGTAFSGISNTQHGGGGGGASQAGASTRPSSIIGSGGTGVYSSEYSTLGGSPSGWFAGGGGGSTSYTSLYIAPGGNGGGGRGGNSSLPSVNGVINTGGGGGGSSVGGGGTASGGSGIVIIRIPVYYSATFSSGVTYSLTKSGGYSYYVVTATSTTSETVSFS